MMNESNIELHPLSKEEAEIISKKLDAIQNEHSAQIVLTPIITPDGRLSAKAEVFKKVELPVPSPFIPNEEGNGDKKITETD